MNVARVCKIIPSALPHEYFGYSKTSLEGMLLTIELVKEVQKEERDAMAAAQSGKGGSSSSDAASRIAKHNANK